MKGYKLNKTGYYKILVLKNSKGVQVSTVGTAKLKINILPISGQ